MIYNNEDLILEKQRVALFMKNRALEKHHPKDYVDQALILLEEMYEITQLQNKNIAVSLEYIKAYEFAENAHISQKRRFIDLPYIYHPVELATRLLIQNIDTNAIIGALLHDVVEDCNVSLKEIENKFGKMVAYYVYYLSDIAKPEDGNREYRLKVNFQHFSESNDSAHNIKLVDLISNTRSLVFCDPRFSTSYTPELLKAMDYFEGQKSILDVELLTILQGVANISNEILILQNQYNIPKLESKKNNQQNKK